MADTTHPRTYVEPRGYRRGDTRQAVAPPLNTNGGRCVSQVIVGHTPVCDKCLPHFKSSSERVVLIAVKMIYINVSPALLH